MNKSVDAAHDSPLDPNECTRANRMFFKRLTDPRTEVVS